MKRINILPKEIWLEYKGKNRWRYIIRRDFPRFVLAIFILEITLFSSIHVVKGMRLNRLTGDFKKIKKEISQLLVKVNNKEEEISRLKKEITGVDKKIDDAEEKLSLLALIRKKPKDHSHILAEVGTESPRRIWIANLSIKDDELKIIGGSYDTLSVTRLMSNLQQSPFFANADFVYTKKGEIEKVGVVEFEITCNVIRRKR